MCAESMDKSPGWMRVTTVEPVHKDHSRKTQKVVPIGRWSLCTG